MVADAQVWSPVEDRRIYAVWLALVWVGILAGFGVDIGPFLKQRPAGGLMTHIHAIAMVAWLGLFTTQILLVESGRVALHRKLGVWTAAATALIIPIGVVAGVSAQVRLAGTAVADPPFLSVIFIDLILLGLMTTAGVLARRDAPAHKRLMILALIAIADPGYARLVENVLNPHYVTPAGFFLTMFWGNATLIAAMAAWDLLRRRRLHPAFIGGAATILAGEVTASLLYYDAGWRAFTSALVRTWGWSGV